MSPLRIGFGVPRGIGEPARFGPPNHRHMLGYAQRAEALGFDSVWVPDHVFFERRPGVPVPYPEAWTLMTAIGATTERVQIGSADGEPLRSTLELFAHEVLPRVRKMQVTA